jgi:hypothetical protein
LQSLRSSPTTRQRDSEQFGGMAFTAIAGIRMAGPGEPADRGFR